MLVCDTYTDPMGNTAERLVLGNDDSPFRIEFLRYDFSTFLEAGQVGGWSSSDFPPFGRRAITAGNSWPRLGQSGSDREFDLGQLVAAGRALG